MLKLIKCGHQLDVVQNQALRFIVKSDYSLRYDGVCRTRSSEIDNLTSPHQPRRAKQFTTRVFRAARTLKMTVSVVTGVDSGSTVNVLA